MSNLDRSTDDLKAHEVSWDQVSPQITEAPDDDRRTPPAIERMFAELARPWDHQLQALEAAEEELDELRRQRDRLHNVRSQLLQSRKTEQLARADLDNLALRRNSDVAQAAAAVPEQPRRTHKRRVEEAREEAARWFDERMASARRLTDNRLRTAMQEHRRLRDEEQQLLLNPLIADPIAMRFVDEMYAAVHATIVRDHDARSEALEPWSQLRGTNGRVVDELRQLDGDAVLAGLAVGQGPINLVAGRHLVLVEVRRGRDGVAINQIDGDMHLEQVRPDGNVPLGLTTGSTADLHAAADAVADAVGFKPTLLVCVSAWMREPETLGDLLLCGPTQLRDVIGELDEDGGGVQALRAGAVALAARPLPAIATSSAASLDHFTNLDPEDVPEGLPLTRDVIVLANERRSGEAG